MKKLSYLLGIGVMALASCSSDNLVSEAPIADSGAQVPMGFSIHSANMSRGDNLKTVSADFGVWAYKGATDAAIKASDAESNVMTDYLVGYQEDGKGYIQSAALTDFTTLTTSWFYEGLGYNDGWSFVVFDNDVQTDGRNSSVGNQYLRYWDASATYTYFYAYAPYIDKDATARVSFDKTSLTMTFPEINSSTASQYMFASEKCTNATMISNATKVNLTFKRLASQIRIAFYGSIPGYTVEIADLNSGTYDDIYFVPSERTGAPGSYTYTGGEYTSEATPQIVFTEGVGAVTYTGATPSSDNFVFDIDAFSLNGTTYTPTTKTIDATDKLYGPKIGVIPASTEAGEGNDGLTLNVTLKLTADGTGEVLYIKGVRCHVPYNYTQWLPNTLYTYVFKITKKVSGSTGGSPTPSPEPSPNPALVPIIFDQITVVDLDTNEVVYDYFDLDGNTVPAIP